MLCLRNCFLPALMLAVSVCYVSAQTAPVAALVQRFRDQGGRFESVGVFTPAAKRPDAAVQFAPKAQFLTLDIARLAELYQYSAQALTLQLPYHDETLTIDLLETPVHTADFSVITSNSGDRQVNYSPGRHYRGIIRGDERSVVAFSFFQNGIMGLLSDDRHGNLVLGNLENPGNLADYIMYSDREVAEKPGFACQTLDHDLNRPAGPSGSKPDVNGCVRVYFEADYELFQNKGSVQATVDYLAGAFNQLATLYANEQISVTLSQVYVWVSPDNYSVSSSSTVLGQFKSLRKSYNGDIAHLVGIGGNNLGGIAYVDVLCVPAYAYAFSDISTSYSTVPTYSWTVEVLTHEMGHNLGSPHTQSCTWPGGAIDNCFTPEGSCSPGPAPVNGGTIMSYCHLTNYGINFNNGFGPLPGDKIRAEVANAACLAGSCASPGTCLAPKSLTVSNISGSGATVSWSAVGGATGYNLQWRAVGDLSWTTVNNASNPYNLSGLPANDEIEIQVQTICGAGTSAYSYGIVFISSSGGSNPSCGTPGNLTATATSSSSAVVSWGAVTGAGSYQLSYKTSSSSTWSNPVNLSTTSYTLNGLTAATTYNVRVSATCSGVVSNYATTSFTTSGGSGGATCSAPGNLTASANSASAADISWNAVAGASYYQLYYKPSTSYYWSSAIFVNGTAYTLSGLSANTTYNVRVRTICSSGTSGFVSSTFTTQSSGGGSACATPSGFGLVNVTATSATIKWNTVNGATGYDLQIKLSTSSTWMTFQNLPTTVVQITNMQPGKTYNARVRARCSGTNNFSAYTTILNITTPSNVTETDTPVALPDDKGVVVTLENAKTDVLDAEQWQIKPNPTTGQVTVAQHSSTDAGPAMFEWYDQHGRLLTLQQTQTTENNWQFDLGGYPAGLYFVRIFCGDKQPSVQRVVKQ